MDDRSETCVSWSISIWTETHISDMPNKLLCETDECVWSVTVTTRLEHPIFISMATEPEIWHTLIFGWFGVFASRSEYVCDNVFVLRFFVLKSMLMCQSVLMCSFSMTLDSIQIILYLKVEHDTNVQLLWAQPQESVGYRNWERRVRVSVEVNQTWTAYHLLLAAETKSVLFTLRFVTSHRNFLLSGDSLNLLICDLSWLCLQGHFNNHAEKVSLTTLFYFK